MGRDEAHAYGLLTASAPPIRTGFDHTPAAAVHVGAVSARPASGAPSRGFRSLRLAFGVGVAALSVALGACSGTSDTDGPGKPPAATAATPSVSTSPSASESAEDAARRRALAAYRGMWADMAAAGESADHRSPLLARHATGAALTQIVQGLYVQAQKGQVSRGQPVLHPTADEVDLSATPAKVVVQDCADSSNWLLYTRDGKKVDDAPGGRRRISADVRGTGEVWRVVDFRVRAVGTC